MITTFYPPYSFGGDALYVQRLSRELVRRGNHVEVIHCVDAYRALASRDPIGTYQDEPGLIVHGLHSPLGPLSALATQQTGFPIFKSSAIQRVLGQGFDVIHFHNISLVGGPGILSYGRGLKLYTLHEHWLVCPTHVLFKYNREICQRRHCFLCQLVYCRPPQLWRYSRLVQRMAGHVDAFIAPSHSVMENHCRLGMRDDVRIVVLPNFVPRPTLPPVPPARSQEDSLHVPYFLFVGRLERLKGLQTLIPLFQDYQRAAILIAGAGAHEPQLRSMARGIAGVHFLGPQPAARVQALMRGAVALIVPSICLEVFPTVTVEAFSQGTPAIARDIGSLREQIEQSSGGLLYKTDAELLSAMDRLLADRAYRDDLGRRASQAYRKHWTPEAHIERYLALIGNLSAQGR